MSRGVNQKQAVFFVDYKAHLRENGGMPENNTI